jgi:TPR repeat protein
VINPRFWVRLRASRPGNFLWYSRAWRHGLLQPLYVPSELRQVRDFLSQGDLSAALNELSTRATLGSNSAAATLDYICLRHPSLPSVDYELTARLCRASANRSYPYAQYVVACREYQQGNFKSYARWLHRAARANFPPAISDLGRAVIEMPGNLAHGLLAKRCFRRALVRGHVLSALYFLRACKDGKFGGGMLALGYVAFPFAVLCVTPICRLCPFSAGLFSHPLGLQKPLFASL